MEAVEQLREFGQSIFELYQNFDFDNAAFVAERMRVCCGDSVSRLVLAECYIADQRYANAYSLLRGHSGERARYLFALCCLKLNKDAEVEEALGADVSLDRVINGGFGLQLLGKHYERVEKKALAAECYLRAYRRNPLLFSSLERYGMLAAALEGRRMADVFAESPAPLVQAFSHELMKLALSGERKAGQSPSPEGPRPVLRKEPSKPVASSTLERSRWRKPGASSPKPHSAQRSRSRIATTPSTPVELLRCLGKPFLALLSQDAQSALEGFLALSPTLLADPWVLVQLGKSCTELYDHAGAERHFREAFERDPHRVNGLEYYSSCLYHLKRQTELAQLGAGALSQHFFRAETWMVLANSFSLAGDHAAALDFLARAVQLDPFNSYAYCLAGHEHLAREGFDQAKEAYQRALTLDPRNIRALWGLGILSMKTERFDRAIHFFGEGLVINDRCSPFHTQLASAHLGKGEAERALGFAERAERLSPADAYNRFVKAQILARLQRPEEALRECQLLVRESQKEAAVFALMGQMLQGLGRVEEALRAFNAACSLDKKDTLRVKALIEALPLPSELI